MVPTLGEGGAGFVSSFHTSRCKKMLSGSNSWYICLPPPPPLPLPRWLMVMVGGLRAVACLVTSLCDRWGDAESAELQRRLLRGFPTLGRWARFSGGARWESRQTSVHFSTLQRTRRCMGRRWWERGAFLASKPGKLALSRLPRVKVYRSRGWPLHLL